MKEEVQKWLKKARDDLRVVEHEMSLPPEERVASAVCFHAQQFVEKCLKAFLVAYGKEFPRTHNLSFLKRLCAEIDRSFQDLDIDELSLYAVELRYPGEFAFKIGPDESARCAEAARTVKDFIETKLGFKFESLDSLGEEEKGVGGV